MKISNIKKHFFKLSSWHRLFSHLLSFPRLILISRKVNKIKNKRNTNNYKINVKVSAILQFFNKYQNINMLMDGLERSKFDELIIIDDGSIDNSFKKWKNLLKKPNNFLIHSNDLFEVITYNRAINFTNAEFVCLLQDDDKLPYDSSWVDSALKLFELHPDLIILGGNRALDILPFDNVPVSDTLELNIADGVESVTGLFKHKTYSFDGSGTDDFIFAMAVVRAPTFIRRKEFLSMGGFDLDFSPFLCDDIDYCLRAWRSGFKVGLYNVDFRRDIGLGGMRAFNAPRFEAQLRKNWSKIYHKHGDFISDGVFLELVRKANIGITGVIPRG